MLRVPIILYHGGNNINWGMAKRFNAPDFDSGIFAGPNPATSAIMFTARRKSCAEQINPCRSTIDLVISMGAEKMPAAVKP